MTTLRKKRKFSVNQVVAFRFSDRKLIGTVVLVRPVGKNVFYDVMGENGTYYSELEVDTEVNHCIDTYLTKLFYHKYNIDENSIPEIVNPSPAVQDSTIIETDRTVEDTVSDYRELYIDEDEYDPNY